MDKVSRVNEWLWVGGAPDLPELQDLYTAGVRLDIDTTAELSDPSVTGIGIVKLGWSDDGTPKPLKDFARSLTATINAIFDGDGAEISPRPNILVHCAAGINRGPTLATFLLSYVSGCSPEEAWNRISQARPGVNGWNVPAYRQSIVDALTTLRGQ